jgi:hypothetical protein
MENPRQAATHRNAVIMMMEAIQAQLDYEARRTARLRGKNVRSFQFAFDRSKVTDQQAKQISWRQFLGYLYDHERKGLIVLGKGLYEYEWFFHSDPACKEYIFPRDRMNETIGKYRFEEFGGGFAYAFSQPPYRLQISTEELGVLFDDFLRVVIGGSENSAIYLWATDWSGYFDPEALVGPYLWSLSTDDDKRIVTIAVSASD